MNVRKLIKQADDLRNEGLVLARLAHALNNGMGSTFSILKDRSPIGCIPMSARADLATMLSTLASEYSKRANTIDDRIKVDDPS